MESDLSAIAPEVVEAFTAAAVAAFQELTETSIAPGAPGRSLTPLTGDAFAAIDLRRAIPGRFVLAFPHEVLETLACRYLPGETLSPEMLDDAAGEFANVIAGQAKAMLKGTPYHFHLSTPQVTRDARRASAGTALRLPFTCDVGTFVLHIELPPCAE